MATQPPLEPDTPAQAAKRKEYEDQLRAAYGDRWMARNKDLLDDQWEYLRVHGLA
jgi:hypothetical protein